MDSPVACSFSLYSFNPAGEAVAVGALDPSPNKSFDLGEEGDIPGTPPGLVLAAAPTPAAPRRMNPTMTERDEEIIASVAEYRKQMKQMIKGIPRLFDSLLDMFLGMEKMEDLELVKKISASHEVIPRMVSDQLDLILGIAPEWIREKKASTGQVFISVEKIPSPEPIRTRLLSTFAHILSE